MYTSGTTGRPKGAEITYRMGVFNAIQCAMMVGLTAQSRNLVFLPTFHTGGLNVYANPTFHTGGCNVVMRSFEPALFLRLLSDRALGLTHALGVPTNFLMLAQEPGFAAADLSHIVSLGIGGAAAPLALIEAYGRKGIKLQQCWGMTETGPLGLLLSGEMALAKVGSSGLPPLYVRLKICDPDGNEVKRGETGELMIKGPTVTRGYWNRPEANRTAFTQDGWFHTGDAARQDDDGYYYIVDRWKDMFISGGENVYPVEVENVIYQLDGVLENAVIGVPHEKWGEVGRAFVVLKSGRQSRRGGGDRALRRPARALQGAEGGASHRRPAAQRDRQGAEAPAAADVAAGRNAPETPKTGSGTGRRCRVQQDRRDSVRHVLCFPPATGQGIPKNLFEVAFEQAKRSGLPAPVLNLGQVLAMLADELWRSMLVQ